MGDDMEIQVQGQITHTGPQGRVWEGYMAWEDPCRLHW